MTNKHLKSLLCIIMIMAGVNAWGELIPLSLPKTWDNADGKGAYTEELGCTLKGLGTDFANAPKLKFDDQGDYMIIQVADSPSSVSFNIKGSNATSKCVFSILESSDGVTYTNISDIKSISSSIIVNKVIDLKATSRYIKFIYATKDTGTIGIGGVSISKANENVSITSLSIPENLISTNITSNSAVLSWNTVTNASGYKVKIGTYEYDTKENSFTADGLLAETLYTWTVKAVGDGESYSSSEFAENASFMTRNASTSSSTQNHLFYESFDGISGTGGNDNLWNGTISTASLSYDNSGWSAYNAKGANKCIKVGSTTAGGYAITPQISFQGSAKITFKAGAWNNESEKTVLQLSADNATLSQTCISMTKGAWTNYTIYISNVNSSTKIKFEATDKNNRFFLDEIIVDALPTSADITISSAGYATFVTPCALNFENSSVTAYTVSADLANSIVLLSPVTQVPAGKAIVVKGATTTHKIPAIASADDITTALIYSSETTAYSSTVDRYYLGVEGGEVGFRKLAEGGSIAAGKCFFEVEHSPAKFLTMSFDDEVSGISVVENAQNNGVAYNLAGQRVNANAKGIVIINGKKYFNK